MNVRFLRVLGIRSHEPAVVAIVNDTHRVRWGRGGWDCNCEAATCPHVDQVADLLDPKVTGEDQ